MKILTRLVAIGVVIVSILTVSIYFVGTKMPDPKENAIECAKQIIWDNMENTSSITFPWRKNKWDISQTGDTFHAIVDFDTTTFYDAPAKKTASVYFTVTGTDENGDWQYLVDEVSILDMEKLQGVRPAEATASTETVKESTEVSSKAKTSKKEPTQKATSKTSVGKKNALQSAKEYLETMAFSYYGLKKQLMYEGYSDAEATYGVEHCGANWERQAEKMAKEYLRTSSYSRRGLIEQLEYEGFSNKQAVHGVNAVGY